MLRNRLHPDCADFSYTRLAEGDFPATLSSASTRVPSLSDELLSPLPRQPRKKLNSLEPTLMLGHLLCKFLS